MRKLHLLLGVALGSAGVIIACGGSTNDGGGGTPDSGIAADTSVADTSVADTSIADTSVADTAPCIPDASLNAATATLPDASLDDGGGVASVGACVACGQAKCGDSIAACNLDCKCVDDSTAFLKCMAAGGSLITCGAGLLQGANAAEQGFGLCLASSCSNECNIHLGGTPDASTGDAASEASTPSDAASEGG